MSELEKQAKTPYEVWNQSVTHSEPLWVTLEVAQKAVAEKNKELFAELTDLEAKVEAFRKYIEFTIEDEKESDSEFSLTMNSINGKFEELFGEAPR
jgi:hypothetical protein